MESVASCGYIQGYSNVFDMRLFDQNIPNIYVMSVERQSKVECIIYDMFLKNVLYTSDHLCPHKNCVFMIENSFKQMNGNTGMLNGNSIIFIDNILTEITNKPGIQLTFKTIKLKYINCQIVEKSCVVNTVDSYINSFTGATMAIGYRIKCLNLYDQTFVVFTRKQTFDAIKQTKINYTNSLIISFKKPKKYKLFKRCLYDHLNDQIEEKIIVLENPTEYIIYNYVDDIILKKLRHIFAPYPVGVNMVFELTTLHIFDRTIIISYKNYCSKCICEEKVKIYRITDSSDIPESEKCVICKLLCKKNKILVPCGHVQFCDTCITKLSTCPICNESITSICEIRN